MIHKIIPKIFLIITCFGILCFVPSNGWSESPKEQPHIRVLLWQGAWKDLPKANPRFALREKKFWFDHHFKKFPEEGPLLLHLKRPILVGKIWCHGRLSVIVHPKVKQISLINEVPLELYVQSVLAGEVYPHWGQEALKSMSVAIRTYAIYQIHFGKSFIYHLRADERSQVFRPDGIKAASGFVEATRATKGQILVVADQPILALYSASCGGASAQVGMGEIHYLSHRKQRYCKENPEFTWSHEVDSKTLAKQLGLESSRVQKIRILQRTPSNRVRQLRLQNGKETVEISGVKFRTLLGNRNLKSLRFTHKYSWKQQSWIFKGFGHGHGHGLCQWGSKTLADRGMSYRKILQKFYPGTVIQTMGDSRPSI